MIMRQDASELRCDIGLADVWVDHFSQQTKNELIELMVKHKAGGGDEKTDNNDQS